MQCRPCFAKKEKLPLMVTTVSDPAIAAFGNIEMPEGSLNTEMLTAIWDDPSSKVTKVEKTPTVAHTIVQMPELDDDTVHSNIELERAVEHLQEPWKFSPKKATLNNLFTKTEMFRDENDTRGNVRMIMLVDMTAVEGIGLVFMIASFRDVKICPEGIKDDQLIASKLHKTVVELINEADALNNPSAKEQYIGNVEVHVEIT